MINGRINLVEIYKPMVSYEGNKHNELFKL